MKLNFFAVTLLWLMALVARANDGVYFVNGNQIVPLQETDVEVTKEVLTISICDDGYACVDVLYEFTNRGQAKVVDMGFEADAPYNSDDDAVQKSGKHPYIHDFTVEMNGQSLPIRNYVMKSGNDEEDADFVPLDLNLWRDPGENDDEWTGLLNKQTKEHINYAYAYCFKANFKEGKNVVHHTYRYKMSGGIYRHFEIPYWLMPAMRWANHQIDDFTLRIKAENTAKQFSLHKGDKDENIEDMWRLATWRLVDGAGKMHVLKDKWDNEYYEFSLRNGTYEWHVKNFRPTENILITSPESMLYYRDDFKLGRFYDRTASVLVPYELMEETDDGPKFSTDATTEGILNSRILRNLPYANRGYVFKDQKLANYFKSLWWYMPDPSWQQSTADFTEEEQEWIKK